jgi:hypothetical protein
MLRACPEQRAPTIALHFTQKADDPFLIDRVPPHHWWLAYRRQMAFLEWHLEVRPALYLVPLKQLYFDQ